MTNWKARPLSCSPQPVMLPPSHSTLVTGLSVNSQTLPSPHDLSSVLWNFASLGTIRLLFSSFWLPNRQRRKTIYLSLQPRDAVTLRASAHTLLHAQWPMPGIHRNRFISQQVMSLRFTCISTSRLRASGLHPNIRISCERRTCPPSEQVPYRSLGMKSGDLLAYTRQRKAQADLRFVPQRDGFIVPTTVLNVAKKVVCEK